MVSVCLRNEEHENENIKLFFVIINYYNYTLTNLPKRLAMMPPLKPPSIPPMAKIDTANE